MIFLANAVAKSKRTEFSNVATGFVLWQSVDNWIDFVLYPFVLAWLGFAAGFAVMFFVTLAGNAVYIHINNSTEADWTLMNAFTNLPAVKKVTEWKLGGAAVGRLAIFTVLALKFDSFYAVNFLHGKRADLRRPSIMATFLGSHVAANAMWTGLWGVLLVPAKMLWEAASRMT